MKKSNKRTPRIVAQTLALSLVMGTVVPTSGLGRVVYAEEETTEQGANQSVETVQEDSCQVVGVEQNEDLTPASDAMGSLEDEKDAMVEATSAEAQAVVQAVVTIGQGIISSEVLGIVNEVQAKQDLEKAEAEIEAGEQKVTDALEGFDTDIADVMSKADDAQNAAEESEKEAQNATAALEQAKEAQTSQDAKEEQKVAEDAASKAQEASNQAKEDAQGAKDAYVEAEKAYQEAVKEAAQAQEKAQEAIDAATEDAKEAAEKAAQAQEKAQELKGQVDAAREQAEAHFTEKEAELANAQKELDAAKEALDIVVSEETQAREELKTATEAVVETGAFLVAAEAYEALSEITVAGIETAIVWMEEAKEAADKALADAEEALANAQGNEAEAQAAYDAAFAAYQTANATLEQAKSDLEVATNEQEAAKELAASDYGQILQNIEKELLEAEEQGNHEAAEQKAQELVEAVIKYDQSSAEAKYETVKLVDTTSMIYEATDKDGNTAYYQYVKNTDGSFSFYECNKNEEATNIVKRENVTELPSFDGMEEWEYDVIALDGGSYEIVYYDVKDAEQVFTNAEDANNSIAEDANKKIYEFEVKVESDSKAIAYPTGLREPIKPVNLETFLANHGIKKVEEPKREDYKTSLGYAAAMKLYQIYLDGIANYDAAVKEYDIKKADYDAKMTVYNNEKAQRQEVLRAELEKGRTLTILVDGVEKNVLSDEYGFYYIKMEFGKELRIYNADSYDIHIKGTDTNYRVVEYNEITKVDYAKVDNLADDSYENVTNRVVTAEKNYVSANAQVTTAEAQKESAQKTEQAAAAKLEEAELKLEKAQEEFDKIEEEYNSYYGNKKVTIDTPFGEVEMERPLSSQYASDKATLELAKIAAKENLKAAQEEVKERREAHSEAVKNLEEKTVAYSEAIQHLAGAAIEVGQAELKVGTATVDLAAAKGMLEASKVAQAYAMQLETKVVEARQKAEAAKELVEELQANLAVGSEKLAEAEAALIVAEMELHHAEKAAADAQIKADEAKAAYDKIAVIVAELVEKENAVTPDDGKDDHNKVEDNKKEDITASGDKTDVSSDKKESVDKPVIEMEADDTIVIEEENVPLEDAVTEEKKQNMKQDSAKKEEILVEDEQKDLEESTVTEEQELPATQEVETEKNTELIEIPEPEAALSETSPEKTMPIGVIGGVATTVAAAGAIFGLQIHKRRRLKIKK